MIYIYICVTHCVFVGFWCLIFIMKRFCTSFLLFNVLLCLFSLIPTEPLPLVGRLVFSPSVRNALRLIRFLNTSVMFILFQSIFYCWHKHIECGFCVSGACQTGAKGEKGERGPPGLPAQPCEFKFSKLALILWWRDIRC